MYRAIIIYVVIIFFAGGTVGQLATFHSKKFSSAENVLLVQSQVNSSIDSIATGTINSTTGEKHVESWAAEGVDKVEERVPFWYEDIPILPILFINSPDLPDGQCKRQVQRYEKELKNGTLWAARMFDASAKYPDGVLAGHMAHLGNFDECYQLHARIPSEEESGGSEQIDGRYCMTRMSYHNKDKPPIKRGPYTLEFDPNDSVWESIRERGDSRRVRRYVLDLALCVPSACNAADIEAALKAPLEQMGARRNVRMEVTVLAETCQTAKESPSFSRGGRIYCWAIMGLIVLVVASTRYDSVTTNEKEKSIGQNLILCFSARRNYKHIFQVNYQNSGLDSIHFIRSIFMVLVIYGHRGITFFHNPMVYTEFFESIYEYSWSMMCLNGPIIIDAFLAIGGLLSAYSLLQSYEKAGRMHFLNLLLIRYLRFAPTFVFVLLFHILILPHLGSGPYWRTVVEREAAECSENFWSYFFFVSNYVDKNQICMFQSWYLSVDFHANIIAIFVMYTFWRLPRRLGYTLLGVGTFASTLIPFVATYVYQAPPVFIASPHIRRQPTIQPDFAKFYTPTHMRLPPYFLGLISGAVLYDHKRSNWKLSKLVTRILFFVCCVFLSITIQNLGSRYVDPNINPTHLERALYAASHRILFGLSACSMVLLLSVGQGLDFSYNFLTPSWVQPIGRLTYSVFLTHTVTQLFHMGSARTAETFTFYIQFSQYFMDVIYAFSIALLLVLGVEAPFRAIERLIMKRSDKFVTKGNNVNGTKKTNYDKED